jgi:hypothetical protein
VSVISSDARDDLGVDQHARVVARIGGVHHDHAFVHIDLRRGQADAVSGVHAFEHVVDQRADALIDPRDGLGDGVQAWIGVAQDVKLGHGRGFKCGARRPARRGEMGATRRMWSRRNAASCDRPHTRPRGGSLSLRYQGFRGRICETD